MEAYGALLLRVTLGGIFIMHAWKLLFLWGPGDTVAFEHSYALPLRPVSFWYVVLAHGVGGVLLALGVLVRWVALLNVPVLVSLVFVVHARQGFFMTRDGGYELALFTLLATLAQALLGPGAFTLKR